MLVSLPRTEGAQDTDSGASASGRGGAEGAGRGRGEFSSNRHRTGWRPVGAVELPRPGTRHGPAAQGALGVAGEPGSRSSTIGTEHRRSSQELLSKVVYEAN